ncbi:MAG: hypothetical protein WBE69_23950, partial [Candidatus Binataceae bacterium]
TVAFKRSQQIAEPRIADDAHAGLSCPICQETGTKGIFSGVENGYPERFGGRCEDLRRFE